MLSNASTKQFHASLIWTCSTDHYRSPLVFNRTVSKTSVGSAFLGGYSIYFGEYHLHLGNPYSPKDCQTGIFQYALLAHTGFPGFQGQGLADVGVITDPPSEVQCKVPSAGEIAEILWKKPMKFWQFMYVGYRMKGLAVNSQ